MFESNLLGLYVFFYEKNYNYTQPFMIYHISEEIVEKKLFKA